MTFIIPKKRDTIPPSTPITRNRFLYDVSKAPYAYNSHKGYFLSYDNPKSIAFKTRYALEKKLKGIMFWELANDLPQEGLLEALVKTANSE